MAGRRYGEIPGIEPGDLFPDRHALRAAGLHAPLQAGISGDRVSGAESIVLSGGYEDDTDFGDVILYTGQGGNDDGRQVGPQVLERGNAALARSCVVGRPVRVIRGSRHHSAVHRPDFGYRYDGLYRVESYWRDTGRAGFPIWRFRLVKLEVDSVRRSSSNAVEEERPLYDSGEGEGTGPVERRPSVIQRIVRNTDVAIAVKDLYSGQCQVCRTTIVTPGGNYSEAAHIRPLGAPHDGPDQSSNVLCLCPNHHVMFDLGAIVIQEDLELINSQTGERLGRLFVHPQHSIDLEHVKYHREMFTDDVVVPFEPEPRDYRRKGGSVGGGQGRLFRAS